MSGKAAKILLTEKQKTELENIKRSGIAQQRLIYHRNPKLGLVSDAPNSFILAFHARSGPRPDVDEIRDLIHQASQRVKLKRIDLSRIKPLVSRCLQVNQPP
jgi:hypothetical protein